MTSLNRLADDLNDALNATILIDEVNNTDYIFVYPDDTTTIDTLITRLPNEYALRHDPEHTDKTSYIAFAVTL